MLENQYENIKDRLMNQRNRLEAILNKEIEKYKEIENSDVDKKEQRLEISKKTIIIRKRAVSQVEDQMKFLRPENKIDMEYRLKQYDEFCNNVEAVIPDDLDLRFHGCPIYAAEKIIESGELSSSIDRLGISTSYDVEDQVSVTTKDTLETTVHGYTHLTGNSFLPAGCIFAVFPKDEQDAEYGKSLLMGNVDFKSNPDRLYSIITTPENLDMIDKWSKDNDIDLTNKLYDFDGFVKALDKEKNAVSTQKLGKETKNEMLNIEEIDKVEAVMKSQTKENINTNSKKDKIVEDESPTR